MPNFNQIQLAGHATRDPEVRYTPSGTALMTFGLAVNQYVKDGDDKVCFIDITVWGKPIEWLKDQIKKGSAMVITGRLDHERWEAEDGTKRSRHKVTAWNVFMIKGKADFEGTDSGGGWEGESQHSPVLGQAAPMTDDDIPF